MEYQVQSRFNTPMVRASLARDIALDLAGGVASRLRPQKDGSVIVVNSPGFDTRTWSQPEPEPVKIKKRRKRNGA